MAEVSIDLNMVRVTNDDFVKKAEACAPELIKTVVRPVSIVDIVKTEDIYPDVRKKDDIENLSTYHMAKGDRICLDFGDHSETEFCGKPAGCTGIFQTEIRGDRKRDD